MANGRPCKLVEIIDRETDLIYARPLGREVLVLRARYVAQLGSTLEIFKEDYAENWIRGLRRKLDKIIGYGAVGAKKFRFLGTNSGM